MKFPLWATPERRQHLAELAELTLDLYEIDLMTGTLYNPIIDGEGKRTVVVHAPPKWERVARTTAEGYQYESLRPLARTQTAVTSNDTGVVGAWKAEDRATRSQLWELEQRRLHAMPQIKRRGPFGTLDREQYLAERPVFEIVAIGLSAFTQHRVAKVKLHGLGRTVWVDLHGLELKGIGKSKLRSICRHGGSVPKELVPQIDARVRQAVARYL